MAEVVLFHHAQGLTPGVVSFAEQLRAAGHVVHTPDVYDGRTFDTLEAGVGYAREVGFAALSDRAVRAIDGLPGELVYAGFSLGASSRRPHRGSCSCTPATSTCSRTARCRRTTRKPRPS